MDLERQAKKLVEAAKELAPTLRKSEQVAELSTALLLWGTYPRVTNKSRAKTAQLERYFLVDAIAVTMDRRNSLWCRNASWALFFVARSLGLVQQNYEGQAAKQLTYAEEELQLGVTAKAMVFARDRTNKARKSRPKPKTARNLRRR